MQSQNYQQNLNDLQSQSKPGNVVTTIKIKTGKQELLVINDFNNNDFNHN